MISREGRRLRPRRVESNCCHARLRILKVKRGRPREIQTDTNRTLLKFSSSPSVLGSRISGRHMWFRIGSELEPLTTPQVLGPRVRAGSSPWEVVGACSGRQLRLAW